MKCCPSCERELTVEDFHKDKSTGDGLACYCKECKRRYDVEHYAQNKIRIRLRHKENHKKYYATIKGHLKIVFGNINKRCNDTSGKDFGRYRGRGIQNRFKSLDEFRDYITDELQVDPRGLQIDRIDNDGHYEKGNIRFVTAKENCANRERGVAV